MDVSAVVQEQQAKLYEIHICRDLVAYPSYSKSTAVEKEIPLEVDLGLLTVTDPNPTDSDAYKSAKQHIYDSIIY